MIDVIANRRTTVNGKTYEKGVPDQMALDQFNALEPISRFERAPKPKPEPKAKATPSKSSDNAD